MFASLYNALKGWKTLGFNTIFTVGGIGTVDSLNLPPHAEHVLTIGVAAAGLINFILRLDTDTPAGKKVRAEEYAVGNALGFTPGQVDQAVGLLGGPTTLAGIGDRLTSLETAMAAIPAPTPAPSPAPAAVVVAASAPPAPKPAPPATDPPVTALPAPDASQAGFSLMSMALTLIGMAAIIFGIVACAVPITAKQRLFTAESGLTSAVTAGNAYRGLPTCGTGVCKTDTGISALNKAQDIAVVSMRAAEVDVLGCKLSDYLGSTNVPPTAKCGTPLLDQTALSKAVTVAEQSLSIFQAAVPVSK